MGTFYHLTVEFSCPSCEENTASESVIEMEESSPDKAILVAQGHPLVCAICHETAADGTPMEVDLFPISADEFHAWTRVHPDNPHLSKS